MKPGTERTTTILVILNIDNLELARIAKNCPLFCPTLFNVWGYEHTVLADVQVSDTMSATTGRSSKSTYGTYN